MPRKVLQKLEMVGINDARCNVIANLRFLGTLGHQRLIFDGFICVRYVAPPYSALTIITASVYGRLAKEQHLGTVDKISGPVLSRLLTKIHKILG